MDRLVRVLLVEDSPGDAALLRAVLLKPPPVGEFLISHADTLQGAVERLKEEPFDAILLDLNLPDSQHLDTVRRMRAAAADTPIIVLTSVGDESTGVEALQLGAQDYLVKGTVDCPTLSRSVQYALERGRLEAELRKANEQLQQRVLEQSGEMERSILALGEEKVHHRQASAAVQEAEDRFRAIVGALPDAFFIVHPNLEQTLYCNAACEKLWGRSRVSLLQEPRSWIDAIHPDDRRDIESSIQQWVGQVRAKSGQGTSCRFRVVRPDGSTAAVRCRLFAIYGRHGNLCYVGGVAEDLADLAKDATTDGDAVIAIGQDNTITTWSNGAECLFGLPAKQALGQPFYDVLSVTAGKPANESLVN